MAIVGPGSFTPEAPEDALLGLDGQREHVGANEAELVVADEAPQLVVVDPLGAVEELDRRHPKLHLHLREALREALAVAQQEGHAGPPPAVDLGPQGDVGLRLAVLGDPLLVEVTGHRLAIEDPRAVAGAHGVLVQVLEIRQLQRLEHRHLGVPHRLRVEAGRRLHGDEGEDLEHVVLEHVPEGPDAVVVGGAARGHAHGLGDGDLHQLDVVAVPQGLEDGVVEAETQHVLDRLLAEVVVDAEELVLVEHAVQLGVELRRALEVVAEGLLDDHPVEGLLPDVLSVHDAHLPQVVGRHGEERGLQGQVAEAGRILAAEGLELPLQLDEAGRVAHVALAEVDVGQHRLDVPPDGLAEIGAEGLVAHRSTADADHLHIEALRGDEESRDELATGQVAAAAEDDDLDGLREGHGDGMLQLRHGRGGGGRGRPGARRGDRAALRCRRPRDGHALAQAPTRGGPRDAAAPGGPHRLRRAPARHGPEPGPRARPPGCPRRARHRRWDDRQPVIRERFGDVLDELPADAALDPDRIADAYWHLHTQDPSAWTFELDLRPWCERF
jgi:hypothetical protein